MLPFSFVWVAGSGENVVAAPPLLTFECPVYFWRVDAIRGNLVTRGAVWNFTVASQRAGSRCPGLLFEPSAALCGVGEV